MGFMNKTFLLGNLTRDVELRTVGAGGTSVADIGMAVNEVRKDKDGNRIEETTFVDITLWGRQAEIAAQYVNKGDQLLVEGKLKLDTWEDKETGQKRSKLKVVGERISLMGRKPGSSEAPSEAPPVQNDDIPF